MLFLRCLTNLAPHVNRLFPNINFELYSHKAERQAVNSVIQGTAADLVKLAMLSIDKEIFNEDQRELQELLSTACITPRVVLSGSHF